MTISELPIGSYFRAYNYVILKKVSMVECEVIYFKFYFHQSIGRRISIQSLDHRKPREILSISQINQIKAESL